MGVKKSDPQPEQSPSRLIDARIEELGDWRGQVLGRLRRLIKAADPGVVEEWKWGGPVWSHDGLICTGETYKDHVKMTFARGAFLPDPARVFNSSLAGNTRRAIDLHEGETVVVLTREPEEEVLLSPGEEAELLEAIAEADRGETISAEELFARLDRLR